MPYADRAKLIKQREQQAEQVKNEAEALRWLLEKVKAMPDAEL